MSLPKSLKRTSCLLARTKLHQVNKTCCIPKHNLSTISESKYTQNEWYDQASKNSINFWREAAKGIEWDKFPETIYNPHDLDHQLNYSWYSDGKLNLTYNALDRHIINGRGNQNAIIHDSPVTNRTQHITFNELLDKVEKCSGALRERGITKGDRVLIYMPMIPEAIISMYACARIGAIHTVVFGGFAAPELAKRIVDCEPKLIISASGGKEINKIIEYKPLLDSAIELCDENIRPKHCLIYQRPDICKASLIEGRDEDFEKVLEKSENVKSVSLNANDPLYILYTSGTTGTPKGIIRETGGHAVTLRWTMEHFYGLNPGDVTFFGSDIGWVVGHSYIVYAPLLQGVTSVMFEGKPIGTPDAGVFWRLIESHGIKSMFAAPTALRAIKKEDPNAKLISKYNLNSLSYLFVAGERCDPNTLQWAESILPSNVIVTDHWWQTETGWPITGRMMGDKIINKLPQCIGSGGQPIPGMYLYNVPPLQESQSSKEQDINSHITMPIHKIKDVNRNTTGELLLKLPLPPGTLGGIWNNKKRTYTAYLERYPGYYCTGDTGHIDDNGFIHIMSRVDDLINVAGHRLSTASMETVLSEHKSIADCCVIGVPDPIKEQIPVGVVVLKSDEYDKRPEEIERETIQMIRNEIGPVAAYKQTIVVSKLPKTRSGKILRRSLREIYSNGDIDIMPATIEDPTAIDEFKEVMERIRKGKEFRKM